MLSQTSIGSKKKMESGTPVSIAGGSAGHVYHSCEVPFEVWEMFSIISWGSSILRSRCPGEETREKPAHIKVL